MKFSKKISGLGLIKFIHQWYWMYVKRPIWDEWRIIPILKLRYFRHLRRLVCLRGARKIRVVFPLSNPSKWKEQTLYDLMELSNVYEPVVALTLMEIDTELTVECQRELFSRLKEFLDKRGCRWVQAFDIDHQEYLSFRKFDADIVWYTQPWRINKIQDVIESSKYALTCYVPYFVQNYGGLIWDCLQPFHRYLWRHFTLNDSWANIFMKEQGLRRAGKTCGFGHPMLDYFYLHRDEPRENRYVIYAPHWSCETGEKFSTFLQFGKKMLLFAKSHQSMHWVFKPHPTLASTLVDSCGWSQDEVNEYYAEWEKFGIACYDGNYTELFRNSCALITDCASFLVEYACVGKPILHLISHTALFQPHPISERLFSTYYQVNNWNEFEEQFNRVVVDGNDSRHEIRQAKIKEMNLCDNYAAEKILGYLDGVLRGIIE